MPRMALEIRSRARKAEHVSLVLGVVDTAYSA